MIDNIRKYISKYVYLYIYIYIFIYISLYWFPTGSISLENLDWHTENAIKSRSWTKRLSMIKLLHTSSTSIFLLTLLPPQRPFYFLEHAKDLPTSGPLSLLFPQLRMHFPYIFLVLCFSIFLWSLLSNPLFLTTLSEIAPHLILSPHSAFFLLPSTPLHDIILYICLCSTSM